MQFRELTREKFILDKEPLARVKSFHVDILGRKTPMGKTDNDTKDFTAVLQWLFEVCEDPDRLRDRIQAARAHYRRATDFANGVWVWRNPFEGFDDRMAIILSQVVAELSDRRTRDVFLASEILPFMKIIGAHVDLGCSGLMYPDTDLGENARHGEVFDEQAKTYIFP